MRAWADVKALGAVALATVLVTGGPGAARAQNQDPVPAPAAAAPATTGSVPAASAPAASAPAGPAAAADAKPKPAARPRGKWPTVKCNVPNSAGKPYYVEFRSRTAVSFGHSFVIFGRVNASGGAASWEVAGLHPAGNDPGTYATGLMVPVPAETGLSEGDLDEIYLSARYCVRLTEAQYRKMVASIRDLQRRSTTWHGPTTNCNTFIGDIARAIGLEAPTTGLIYPEVFVNSIRSMNSGGGQLPNIPVVQWGAQGFSPTSTDRDRDNSR